MIKNLDAVRTDTRRTVVPDVGRAQLSMRGLRVLCSGWLASAWYTWTVARVSGRCAALGCAPSLMPVMHIGCWKTTWRGLTWWRVMGDWEQLYLLDMLLKAAVLDDSLEYRRLVYRFRRMTSHASYTTASGICCSIADERSSTHAPCSRAQYHAVTNYVFSIFEGGASFTKLCPHVQRHTHALWG